MPDTTFPQLVDGSGARSWLRAPARPAAIELTLQPGDS